MSPEVHELKRLADNLTAVTDRLEGLSGYGRRTRWLAASAIVLFLVDIGLTVVMVFLFLNARSESNAIRAATLTACSTGNELRAEEKALWQGIITTSLQEGPPPGTSRARLDENARLLQALVNKAFVHVDCQKLYG